MRLYHVPDAHGMQSCTFGLNQPISIESETCILLYMDSFPRLFQVELNFLEFTHEPFKAYRKDTVL